MTCETVQDRLLDGAVDHFTELEPHLAGCATCRAMADRIRAAEAEIGQQLDAFMHARPPDWARLEIPAPRRRFGMHSAVLALATAAVLALAVLPALQGDGGTDPRASGNVPALVAEADADLIDFDAIDMSALDIAGLSRAEEDDAIRALLMDKVAAQQAALEAYLAAAETDAPEWRVEALVGVADVHSGMADGLATMIHPSYLDEGQREIYQMALEDKAWAQREKALEAYEQAATVAEEAGLDGRADEIGVLVQELEAEEAAREIASKAYEAEMVAQGLAVEAEMRERLTFVREAVVRCAAQLDPALLTEAQEIVAESDELLEEEEVAMYIDIHEMVSPLWEAMQAVCPE